MDRDDGLFVVGVDGLEVFTLNTRDELIVDESICFLAEELMEVNSVFIDTYSPVGCSYVSEAVLMVCCTAIVLVNV